MPRMTGYLRTLLVGVGAVAILAMASVYALFHGYFDHGEFEIKQFQWSSANQVAMLAERSDDQALGGLEYYVLVGDHLFTPAELRHALYSDAVIFSTSSNDLTLRWDGPNRLIIGCNGPYLEQQDINVEKKQSGSVSISYVNISPNTAQTFRPQQRADMEAKSPAVSR
jgi:hypothetical protein